MKRITDLTILQEYTNDSLICGLYWCKFNGNFKLFTINGDTFDELNEINNDVKIELLREKEAVYITKTTKQQALEREVEVLRTRNAKLEAEVGRLEEALDNIIRPIHYMQREAEVEGKELNWLVFMKTTERVKP